MFTVWLPGNTGLCWKKATGRKTRANVQQGRHVALPLFERLKVLDTRCVRELLVLQLPRDFQSVRRVTGKRVSVNGCVCSDAEPRVAYVYVRATATHGDTVRVRAVRLYSSSSVTPVKKKHGDLYLLTKGRKRLLTFLPFTKSCPSPQLTSSGWIVIKHNKTLELCLKKKIFFHGSILGTVFPSRQICNFRLCR